MKITQENLKEWVDQNLTIRHKGVMYKLRHQGLTADGKPNGYTVKTKRYFLMPLGVGSGVRVYHKGRGVYGLETNKNTVRICTCGSVEAQSGNCSCHKNQN